MFGEVANVLANVYLSLFNGFKFEYMRRKKLQVFVSSTYDDLKQERQAAVEAILQSGHIPAGMELFAAGDESQMKVIQRWIDESDVFLLILGGRYGSIEPTSKRSYTHLEYEYAGSQKKARFAVVMDKSVEETRVKEMGTSVIERDNPKEFVAFREQVTSSAMVKFWTNTSDIKLAIFQTLAEFQSREELVGWIPGNEGFDAGPLAEQMARVLSENQALRAALDNAGNAAASFSGLSFDEMFKALLIENVTENQLAPRWRLSIATAPMSTSQKQPYTEAILAHAGNLKVLGVDTKKLSLLHLFWVYNEYPEYMTGAGPHHFSSELNWESKTLLKLCTYGLMEFKELNTAPQLTDTGRRFFLAIRKRIIAGST